MLLAIVNRGLIALEGGLVNPLQAFFLINGNACATLVADSKVVHRLGVTLVGLLTIAICLVPFLGHIYVNSMMALTSLPIDRETMMPSAIL